METQPLQERINSPSTQHRWHASTQTTRTGMRHMNGEIKTGSEAHRLFHQFFAELQRSGTFTGYKHRIRVLYLAVIRLLKISHTILHLQCAEGASTERSLELFRAYNYTPRIAELLAIRFKWAPVIFSVAKLSEDYRGFCFSGSCKSTSEPVPCHLTAWPATKFLKTISNLTSHH